MRAVATVAGLTVAPGRPHYDVMIVDGGPAGLTAAAASSTATQYDTPMPRNHMYYSETSTTTRLCPQVRNGSPDVTQDVPMFRQVSWLRASSRIVGPLRVTLGRDDLAE